MHILFYFFSAFSFANSPDVSRILSLKQAIEEGLRNNFDEKARKLQKSALELELENQEFGFWYPQLSFVIETDKQKLHRFRSEDASHHSKFPTGRVGFMIGDYTLFNWFKEHAVYRTKRDNILRTKERLAEEKRVLRHKIISGYFEIVKVQLQEKITRQNLKHTAYVYRLNRERAHNKKVSLQEYYQSRSLFLKFQKKYHDDLEEVHRINKEFAYLMGDDSDTYYAPQDNLRFEILRKDFSTLLPMAYQKNPKILDNLLERNNSQRIYDLTLKEKMPLPKITLHFGSYVSSFSSSQARTGFNSDPLPGGGNIELSALIQMKLPIFGEGGMFNGRKNEEMYTRVAVAKANLHSSRKLVETNMRILIKKIRTIENKVDMTKVWLKNAQKKFDVVLENYSKSKTLYLNFKEAIEDLQESEICLEDVLFEHLDKKVQLATEMGVEDFPGENFEKLASSGETKE